MAEREGVMTQSGFCFWPGLDNSHPYCQNKTCTCKCHEEETE